MMTMNAVTEVRNPTSLLRELCGVFALSGKKNGWLARTRRITGSEEQWCYGYERETCIELSHCTQRKSGVKEKKREK